MSTSPESPLALSGEELAALRRLTDSLDAAERAYYHECSPETYQRVLAARDACGAACRTSVVARLLAMVERAQEEK